MARPNYAFGRALIVGCSGPNQNPEDIAGGGRWRSRDAARLKNVANDAEYWANAFIEDCKYPSTLLLDPSVDKVKSQVRFLAAALRDAQNPNPIFTFHFIGHGDSSGGMVLTDGRIGIREILDSFFEEWPEDRDVDLSLLFDCCHSAQMLFEAYTDHRHWEIFTIRDGFAACLHDEKAFETDEFGHGTFTYTMKNKPSLALATKLRDTDISRQDFIERLGGEILLSRDPVRRFTDGKQSSIELVNGHLFEVHGLGRIETVDRSRVSLGRLIAAAEALRQQREENWTITLPEYY